MPLWLLYFRPILSRYMQKISPQEVHRHWVHLLYDFFSFTPSIKWQKIVGKVQNNFLKPQVMSLNWLCLSNQPSKRPKYIQYEGWDRFSLENDLTDYLFIENSCSLISCRPINQRCDISERVSDSHHACSLSALCMFAVQGAEIGFITVRNYRRAFPQPHDRYSQGVRGKSYCYLKRAFLHPRQKARGVLSPVHPCCNICETGE